MTNKRITLTSGDWIKLSDIPNEQVFNLVKQCFINAGFTDLDRYAQWDNRADHTAIRLGGYNTKNLIQFTAGERQLSLSEVSLSDIFNSVNGGWCWNDCDYIHIYGDHVLYGDTKYPSNPPPLVSIKRITDSPEAIIPTKTSQWWDYEKGLAVGLPERGEVVLYNENECDVLKTGTNSTGHRFVLLCLNMPLPDLEHIDRTNLVNITPLDYKTPKQIAVDKALKHSSPAETFEEYTERLYDAGLLKAI